MNVALAEAQTRLAELAQRASSERVVVELGDGSAVELVPVKRLTPEEIERRRQILEELAAAGARKATPGPSAARSQDWLYDEFGAPA
jgi:hypothetical protein